MDDSNKDPRAKHGRRQHSDVEFGSVFAMRDQGGSDTDHVAAHDFQFQTLGIWTDV